MLFFTPVISGDFAAENGPEPAANDEAVILCFAVGYEVFENYATLSGAWRKKVLAGGEKTFDNLR